MNQQMPPNPYAAQDDVVEIAASTSDFASEPLTFKQKALRTIFSSLIAVVFLGSCFMAVLNFNHKQWVSAFATGTCALMCLPFLSYSVPLRLRFSASILILFAMLGLACALQMLFLIRHSPEFDKFIPDSGNRPTILFFAFLSCCLLGIALGGFVGWRVLNRTGVMTTAKRFPMNR